MAIHSWVLRQAGQIEKILVYDGGWHSQWSPPDEVDGQKYIVRRVRLLRKRPITLEAAKELFSKQMDDLGFDAEMSARKTTETKERDERRGKNGTMLTGKEMLLYFKEAERPEVEELRVPNRYNEFL
jgi:hypothetical protein